MFTANSFGQALKRTYGMSLLFLSVLGLVACSKQQEPLNLAGNTWLGYQPLYLIQARMSCPDCTVEVLPGQAVKVTMMPSTTMVLRLFGAGKLDAAMLTLDEALNFQSQTGIGLCVAAILSYSNGADAAMVLPDFQPNRENIKVGYEETALGGFMLQRVVEELDWSPEKLEMQFLVPRNHVDALMQKKVDVVITYEPYISQLKKLGAQVLFDSTALEGEIVDILVVRQSSWRKYQKLLQTLLANQWQDGVAALQNLSATELLFLQNSTELDEAELASALSGMLFVDHQNNKLFLTEKLTKVAARMNEYLLNNKQISRPALLPACE